MKKETKRTVLVFALVILFTALFQMKGCAVESAAEAQELPLSWSNQDGEPIVELSRLFVHVDVTEDESTPDLRRIRPLIYIGHGTCRGKFELNMAATDAINDSNDNWLEIGALECSVSDKTQVSVGRLFLAAPRSTPPPFVLPTVEYPRANPFAAYAYGVQVVHTSGDWTFVADMSGDSGRDFNAPARTRVPVVHFDVRAGLPASVMNVTIEDLPDEGNFDNIESSLRAQYSWLFGDTGFTAQVSSGGRARVGLDAMNFDGRKLRYWFGVYHDTDAERGVQGHVFLSYPWGRFVRPHVMYDWQANGDRVFTWGIEGFLGKHTRLIIDNADGDYAGRVQFRW